MNKKAISRIGKSLAMFLLLSSSLPFSLAYAETVEEVPTSETTISTMADDPLKDKTESTTDHVPTIEDDTEETQTTTSETTSTEETKTTASSTEDSTKKKPKPKPFGGGIGPQTMNLIEGVDIDADFAQLLRTTSTVQNLGGSWSGYGKAQDQLTDDDMAVLTDIRVANKNLTSLKGIEYASNLVYLLCENNQIDAIDVSQNTKLIFITCQYNNLTTLDFSNNSSLSWADCSSNLLTSINVSENINLNHLNIYRNRVTNLDISKSTTLNYLNCRSNRLTSLDVSKNTSLNFLSCASNRLSAIDLNENLALTSLNCADNKLTNIDISKNILLKDIDLSINQLTELDVTKNTALTILYCALNKLNTIDLSENVLLRSLDVNRNCISDISFAFGLTNLTDINISGQNLSMSIPTVSGNQATVDILKTSAQTGLTATNGDISPIPGFTYSGDDIILSNVTRASLSDKYINFSYDGTQLTEGASSGTKSFSGTITFFTASDLVNELSANKKKVNSGEEVEWTWKITSMSVKKAEDVHATLNLPTGLVINPSSIQKNGSFATISDMDGTNSLGNLNTSQTIIFTFKTTASGNADEWLEAKGRLDWKDDTITSPYHNEETVGVQILDEEQTYTPKDSNDIALQSVPISFDYGSHHVVSASAQTHTLGAANYQSNTNVVTDGFYTRVKDDRTTSTGWKLTAKLSEFRDSGNQVMPNGAGTSLKLENMTIERVTDRDTPQEVIDPTPSGADVPSSVTATETLVAGQATAKTLVHAQVNEGRETWQLRMPFDKVSLNVPANAGKKATRYKARLTWSLDDTL